MDKFFKNVDLHFTRYGLGYYLVHDEDSGAYIVDKRNGTMEYRYCDEWVDMIVDILHDFKDLPNEKAKIIHVSSCFQDFIIDELKNGDYTNEERLLLIRFLRGE